MVLSHGGAGPVGALLLVASALMACQRSTTADKAEKNVPSAQVMELAHNAGVESVPAMQGWPDGRTRVDRLLGSGGAWEGAAIWAVDPERPRWLLREGGEIGDDELVARLSQTNFGRNDGGENQEEDQEDDWNDIVGVSFPEFEASTVLLVAPSGLPFARLGVFDRAAHRAGRGYALAAVETGGVGSGPVATDAAPEPGGRGLPLAQNTNLVALPIGVEMIGPAVGCEPPKRLRLLIRTQGMDLVTGSTRLESQCASDPTVTLCLAHPEANDVVDRYDWDGLYALLERLDAMAVWSEHDRIEVASEPSLPIGILMRTAEVARLRRGLAGDVLERCLEATARGAPAPGASDGGDVEADDDCHRAWLFPNLILSDDLLVITREGLSWGIETGYEVGGLAGVTKSPGAPALDRTDDSGDAGSPARGEREP